jgi:hypothetical protein
MERFFFIVGVWVYVTRNLEESRRWWPRLRGVGCFDSRDLKMQEMSL